MGDKTLIQSRSVWAAALVAAAVAALGQFGITISAEQATMISLVVAGVMRWFTSGAISGIVKPS